LNGLDELIHGSETEREPYEKQIRAFSLMDRRTGNRPKKQRQSPKAKE